MPNEKELLPSRRILPEIKIPIIGVKLPGIELPPFPPTVPKLDDRQMEIVRHAVAEDLADLVPVAGDFVGDVSYAQIRELMTPDEYEKFVKDNKWLPSTLAALKAFAEKGK